MKNRCKEPVPEGVASYTAEQKLLCFLLGPGLPRPDHHPKISREPIGSHVLKHLHGVNPNFPHLKVRANSIVLECKQVLVPTETPYIAVVFFRDTKILQK